MSVRDKNKAIKAVAYFLCFLFGIAGSLISLNRFWQYDIFFYDFGIFDQAIWNVSNLNAPIIEHFIFGGKWIFADHFNPSIFLLSPLYWITDKSEIILIAQSAIVALGGLALFYLGLKLTKNSFLSLSILTCYFLFIGLQNAVITDFHEVSVATLPFILIFLSFVNNKKFYYYLSLLIFLGFKESNFIPGIGIGFAVFFLQKNSRKDALATILISLLWGYVAINFIIPHFSSGTYLYQIPISNNPKDYIMSFFNNDVKINTIFKTFLSFGFLPIFSPSFYLLIIGDFLSRFYPPYLTLSWYLTLHYSAITSSIFAVSSLYAFSKIKKLIPEKGITLISIIIIINAFFLYRFVFHGPFGLSYNKTFYAHTKNFKFLNDLLEKVPKNSMIMAPNNLASHLTHQKVILLRDKCRGCKEEYYQLIKPDYIVIDFRSGQNPNNYYGVSDLSVIKTALEKDKNYSPFYKTDMQVIYKKIIR